MPSDPRPISALPRALLFILLLGAGSPLQSAPLEAQRQLFLQAEQALKQGNGNRLAQLKRQLKDYPLLPYLDYQALDGRLSAASTRSVRRFLERHADTPLAGRLRGAWLSRLAKDQRWKEFIDFFQPSKSTRRRCNYANALIHTGHADIAYPQVARLWLVGRSQPKECDPVFDAWRKAGKLTPALARQRVELALRNNQSGLAKYLKRFLPAAQRPWVDSWLRVKGKPRLILDAKIIGSDNPWRTSILLDGLKRLARESAEQTADAWKTLGQRHRFSKEEQATGENIVVSAYIRHDHPQLLSQLERLQPNGDLQLQRRRVLAALENEDWERALFWIEALPTEERASERWRYWKGRALQKLQRHEQAMEVLSQVAMDRTYYAFLAADRIGADYFLQHKPLQVDPEVLERVERKPALRRTRELRALGRTLDAKREWYWLTRTMNADALKAAAVVAERWGWLDQAIFTLARTGYWDDLKFRFPLEHLDLVKQQSSAHDVDITWILAVMRQESAFGTKAHSHAGARGLMQLMPATARLVAKRLGKPRPRKTDLFEPATNIPLGAAYLSQVYHQLNENQVLATAAYNAGPHRVTGWLPERTQDADIWVETIPFKETRNYVKRVMAYGLIYEKRLGLKPGSIIERMPPIRGTLQKATAADNRPDAGSSS